MEKPKLPENLPEYNPFMIQLSIHFRGITVAQLSKLTKISIDVIQGIVSGSLVANEKMILRLSQVVGFPISFFKKWPTTHFVNDLNRANTATIDYMRYAIIRNLNPDHIKVFKPLPDHDLGLNNAKLWKIAGFIVNTQKESELISQEKKKGVDWKSLEDDWFDWLEEKLFNTTEE